MKLRGLDDFEKDILVTLIGMRERRKRERRRSLSYPFINRRDDIPEGS